jgi:hypothetical protein
MLVIRTRKPQNNVAMRRPSAQLVPVSQAKAGSAASVPEVGTATLLATPSDVIEATTLPGTSVPRGRNPTDKMLGNDTPIKQAIIQTQI